MSERQLVAMAFCRAAWLAMFARVWETAPPDLDRVLRGETGIAQEVMRSLVRALMLDSLMRDLYGHDTAKPPSGDHLDSKSIIA